MLERHESELQEKADKKDLGPIKDEMNKLKELLEDLARQIEALKSLGGSNSGVDTGVVVNLTAKIDKLEL